MISRATGLFSIYRGAATNTSGDEIDHPYLVLANVPLSLRNSSTISDNPNTATPRTITAFRGRGSSSLGLRANDRIIDQATEESFLVDSVSAPRSSTRNSDLQFVAHRVN